LPALRDPTELVLLIVVIVSALIAMKILLDLTSKHHRRRYTRRVRFDLAIGCMLGLLLPWIEPVGLTAAATTAILFLGLSVFMLLESKMVSVWRIKMVRREKIREWFLHFSVTTGLIGIVTTLLSIVVPPFLRLSLGFMVPLAFDTLSVMSALLEFTLPSTPYNTIFALIFELLQGRSGGNAGSEILIDDIDKIAHETAHSRFETLDAVENLVEQRLARRLDGGFILEPDGSRLLRVDWQETLARVRIQLDHVEVEIEHLRKNPPELRACLDLIDVLAESVSDLRNEYGLLIFGKRIEEVRRHLADLRSEMCH
jgi:hypothetical protein